MSRVQEMVVGGVRLAFEVHGRSDSPTIVLLHALGQRGRSWTAVVERLAGSFNVLVPDMRGHGDSDWPGSYGFETMGDDVIGLLDALGLRSVVLVGHSMGGVVAYLVAQRRSDLVERLIVEDVCPPYRRDHPIPERPTDARSLDLDWAVVPAIITEVNDGAPDIWAGLEAISAPTLLIGGGEASHIPQEKLRQVAGRIPHCDLVTIPAGHHVHASEPDAFADVVGGWLQEH